MLSLSGFSDLDFSTNSERCLDGWLLESIIKVCGRIFCVLWSFFAQMDFTARVIAQLLKYFIVFIPPIWPCCSWNILGMHWNILDTPSLFYQTYSSTSPCGFSPFFSGLWWKVTLSKSSSWNSLFQYSTENSTLYHYPLPIPLRLHLS